MSFEVRPARVFDDVATVLAPRDPDAKACWCLTYRLRSGEANAMGGRERAACMESLCARDLAPGVLAYDGDLVVGWCSVAPKSEMHVYLHSRTVPRLDDAAVWVINCFRVRGGHGGRGVARALLAGAVDFAREHGAPAVEGYPVDNRGHKVNAALAYVGTRAMFEQAGFEFVSETSSTTDRMPRVLMRQQLGA